MSEPSPNRGAMIALAYLWPLALIPLMLDNDAEVQWHAKHGLVLAAAEILLLCVYIAITSIVSLATLGLGFVLFALVLPFAWVAILVLHVVAIIKGIGGARLIVPGVSSYANRF